MFLIIDIDSKLEEEDGRRRRKKEKKGMRRTHEVYNISFINAYKIHLSFLFKTFIHTYLNEKYLM